LGAAILKHAVAKKWVDRELDSRALDLTRLGVKEMRRQLGISI
jgi:hypothetical protein